MMQLYNYFRSSASFRVRIALNLKNIEYEDIQIHLLNNGGEQFSPLYEQMNPQNLVPTLKHQDKIISQSLAIIEYLDEIYPTPALLPKDPYQKSLIRAFALSISSDIHPLNNLRVLKYLTNDLNISESEKSKWYAHWITKGFTALEKTLTASPHLFNFCFGDTPSLADIFLIPQIFNARRFSCDISNFATLLKIETQCQNHPAFIKAWPENK